ATKKSLGKTRKDLLDQLYKVNEEKRKAIEKYLSDVLWKIQAEVDAVLQGVATYPMVRRAFEPTEENLSHPSYLAASSLMITDKWIDFVQHTNEGMLMSQILVKSHKLANTLHFPLKEGIDLVAIKQEAFGEKWNGPYIGIPFNVSTLHAENKVSLNRSDETYYIFFTPETIQNFESKQMGGEALALSINLLEPFLKWVSVSAEEHLLKKIVDKLISAKEFLQSDLASIPREEEFQKRVKEALKQRKGQEYSFIQSKTDESASQAEQNKEEKIAYYVRNAIEEYNKIGLIWGLSILINSQFFGRDPASPNTPLGMGVVDPQNLCGKALSSSSVFLKTPAYDVEKGAHKIKSLSKGFLEDHLDIIDPPEVKHVFFGNSLKLVSPGKEGKSRVGYLTIATSGNTILGSLARATGQQALFISDRRVISITSREGNSLIDSPWYGIATDKLLSSSSGEITVDGKEYFFLHLAPYKEMDLHFFIFNPKEIEFAFIDSINEKSKELIQRISLQMRLASIGGLLFVLLVLNNIARRITKPISHLARVTNTVETEGIHAVVFPEQPRSKRHDEIYTLYHSFFKMVKGLQEKEKMRGVLNKVVSKEIAEEVLKGNVQLGGEEKRVTVLFADIRNFSAITEKMDPKQVIQLINGCMTKVSKVIDEQGGVIDKYVGDEVMALFGVPLQKKESPLRAIKSGLGIIKALEGWNLERKKESLPLIEMGIGIHTGEVVAGNMGADDRLNYTVLGANVNLSARLCSHAKGMQILISEETLKEASVKNILEVSSLPPITLKGFTEPVPIYEVKGLKGSLSL
ncbi:MAG: adenylate/guanylate cyclase domain-containing protein, partial [Simkania negevensis]|nr:adenylate/guanylate cyclase domain-containing protein [Simkania negevensis]